MGAAVGCIPKLLRTILHGGAMVLGRQMLSSMSEFPVLVVTAWKSSWTELWCSETVKKTAFKDHPYRSIGWSNGSERSVELVLWTWVWRQLLRLRFLARPEEMGLETVGTWDDGAWLFERLKLKGGVWLATKSVVCLVLLSPVSRDEEWLQCKMALNLEN